MASASAQKSPRQAGIPPEETFLGTLNAGHPGWMLPLSERDAETLHHERLPANVCVADASLLRARSATRRA